MKIRHGWEMSVRGNVLVGECPIEEVSFREVSGRRIVRSGKCPSGKCPVVKLSYNRKMGHYGLTCVEGMCAYSKHGLSDSKKTLCASFKNLSNYSKKTLCFKSYQH